MLREGLGVGVQLSGQCVGLGIRGKGRPQRIHQLGGCAVPDPLIGYQLFDGAEDLVRVVARLLLAILDVSTRSSPVRTATLPS